MQKARAHTNTTNNRKQFVVFDINNRNGMKQSTERKTESGRARALTEGTEKNVFRQIRQCGNVCFGYFQLNQHKFSLNAK